VTRALQTALAGRPGAVNLNLPSDALQGIAGEGRTLGERDAWAPPSTPEGDPLEVWG
jgi:thiamine pyrophosphate-dependent acetolactate synthase large subunit-like protein